MSLDFGDISGVEPREIPHEESDLEDDFFCHWIVLKNQNMLFFFWGGGYDIICRGLPGFGSNSFFW